jgi:hypothetical protein
VRAIGLALLVLLLAACQGASSPGAGGPKSTRVNPGPNVTASDPGPNNTANGPQTLQGTLVTRAGCLELDGNAAHQPKTRYALTFANETVGHRGSSVVLTGADGDRTVGPHDTIYVAGHPGPGTGTCGHRFAVDKVVAVVPS